MKARSEDLICVPLALERMRRFPLDGALLLADPRTGLSAICDGAETAGLRMRAPRMVQVRLSIYDDVDYEPPIAMLFRNRLPGLEAQVLALIAKGWRDLLLLVHTGVEAALHLSRGEANSLAARVAGLLRAGCDAEAVIAARGGR